MEDFHIKNRVSGTNRYYIDENLVLWGYGFNDYGQLGIGTVDSLDTFYTEPIRIAENVVSVDASINGYFCIYLTEEGNLYGMASSDGSATQSSNYPFYVELDTSDGLMLGQHVYVEADDGQGTEPKTGLWLPEYYINDIASGPYVWADNGNNRLEKRSLELGAYDESTMEYEIKSGLTEEDAITFPEDGLEEGMKTVLSEDGSLGLYDPNYDPSEDMMEDGAGDIPADGEAIGGADSGGMDMGDGTGMDDLSGTDGEELLQESTGEAEISGETDSEELQNAGSEVEAP